MKTVRLRITLSEVSPVVTRMIDVPHDSTLPELHHLFQVAMGWTNRHLHQFTAGNKRYGVPDPDGLLEQADEEHHRLEDLGQAFGYLYDFGDGWEHVVEVLGPGEAGPGLVTGEGNCPPEDCGGASGYQELLQTRANLEHRSGPTIREFDVARTDILIRKTVGRVPEIVRSVIDLTSNGVKLTPGGRLPRSFIRTVQQIRPGWAFDEKPVAIEEDLQPLHSLHDVLRKVGLLRIRNGVLSPTKSASDDMQVIRRLRTIWQQDKFFDLLTMLLVATLATKGPQDPKALAADLLPKLGDSWMANGHPLDEQTLMFALYDYRAMLEGLDMIDSSADQWKAGYTALNMHAGATALTDLWQSGTY